MLNHLNNTSDNTKELKDRQTANLFLWKEVRDEAQKEWGRILETTNCSYRQFPYWVNAYKAEKCATRFFYCGETNNPVAFVAIVVVGTYPFRSALIDRGPYFFTSDANNTSECLSSLAEHLKSLGFVFVRFTQGQEGVFEKIRDLKGIKQIEPYPFCRDSRNSMLIEQKDDEAETIQTFNETARKRIRRAIRFGYDIRSTSTDSDFEKAWELFEMLASKKGFDLSPRPKEFWRTVLENGAADNSARLYLCSHQGELISAQLHVRDGNICEAMLAALDLDALGDKPSPAALMFFTGMRFGYEFGCGQFNIGGPGDPKRNNHLLEFKRKFKPTMHVSPEPLCLVLAPRRYALWIKGFLRGWRAWKARFGKRAINNSTMPPSSVLPSNEPVNEIGQTTSRAES